MGNAFIKKRVRQNDRVRYIGNQTNNLYYPPYGTPGTVIRNEEDVSAEILWDYGVDEGTWFCEVDDLERDDKPCPYCDKYPQFLVDKKDIKMRINKSDLEIRLPDEFYTLKIKYCLACGRKFKRSLK